MHSEKRIHLNWLKLDILGLLWDRKMYGLDIQHTLEFLGETTSPGQLYPALQKLEDLGAVKCEEKEQKGSNPKYYSITERGKKIFLHNMLPLFFVMDKIVQDKLKDLPKHVIELCEIRQGDVIMDFSSWRYLSMSIAPLISPTGRIFITARNERHKELLEDYLEFEKLDEWITVIISTNNALPDIPAHSVDVAIAAFILHEDDTDWILKEMKRILKPGGNALIIDQLSLHGHFLERFFVEIAPKHSKVGIVMEDVLSLIENNGFKLIHDEKREGIVILKIEH